MTVSDFSAIEIEQLKCEAVASQKQLIRNDSAEESYLYKKQLYQRQYIKQKPRNKSPCKCKKYSKYFQNYFSNYKSHHVRLREKFISITQVYGCLFLFKLANISPIYLPLNYTCVQSPAKQTFREPVLRVLMTFGQLCEWVIMELCGTTT